MSTNGSSGIGTTLNLTGSHLNDKHLHMKQFISTALEYSRTKSEACANQLNRHLQVCSQHFTLW